MTEKMVFITLIGNGNVIASETENTAINELNQVLLGEASTIISRSKENGEVRQSVSVRALHVPLHR